MQEFFNSAYLVFQMFPYFLLFSLIVDRLFVVHRLLTVFIDTHFTIGG